MVSLDMVIERLRRAHRVAILTHQRPDPDALGSQAAAAFLLAKMGATEIYRVQFAEVPGPYKFLLDGVPGETVMCSDEWAARADSVDTVLLVDTCTYQQLEPATAFLKKHRDKVVAIDHHLSRDDIGPLLFKDTDAAACVEILWELAGRADIAVDAALALPLMAGLVGDTGWFRFDSVRPLTHMMAADLVKHVDPSKLYERLMQNESRSKLALMQRALSNVRWTCHEKFACMVLRYADFTEINATQSQTEYLVDMPMIVGSVEVVALMSEMSDGRVRVSLRSKHDIDVNKICNRMGGGGHAKAAGCRLEGPLEAAYTRLQHEVEQSLQASA
ncbi:MAG TPA: DHH family phosphoesterase [Phycisphaerae bacterium]|jgi:phosphoesterase RecJ-like protein